MLKRIDSPFLFGWFCALAFCLLLSERSAFSQNKNEPVPFSESSWQPLESVSNDPWLSEEDKTIAELDYIDKIAKRIIVSDEKYSFETIKFLLKKLSSEKNAGIINRLNNQLRLLIRTNNYLAWVQKNNDQIITAESAKIRLIEMIASITAIETADTEIYLKLFDDFTGSKQPPAVRATAINKLFDKCQLENVDKVLPFISDPDAGVRKAAVDVLIVVVRKQSDKCPESMINNLLILISNPDLYVSKSSVNALISIGRTWSIDEVKKLIDSLKKETRQEIKDAAAELLRNITGQKFGLEAAAWEKWWFEARKAIIPKEVVEGISKGTNFLLSGLISNKNEMSDELILYTLAGRSDIKKNESGRLRQLVDSVMAKDHSVGGKDIYNLSLKAMALAELDKDKYKEEIAQCANLLQSFLSENAGWGYSKGAWDTSISQYAVLGMRACADAGISVPASVWSQAEFAFVAHQLGDGGWGCCEPDKISTHSMTVAGLGSLAICLAYQHLNVKNNSNLLRAKKWIENNFTLEGRGNHNFYMPYYYLYGLERAGMLADFEFFGQHNWYKEGCEYLLGVQISDGSWINDPISTCFAILFMSKATKQIEWVVKERGSGPGGPGGGGGGGFGNGMTNKGKGPEKPKEAPKPEPPPEDDQPADIPNR